MIAQTIENLMCIIEFLTQQKSHHLIRGDCQYGKVQVAADFIMSSNPYLAQTKFIFKSCISALCLLWSKLGIFC